MCWSFAAVIGVGELRPRVECEQAIDNVLDNARPSVIISDGVE